MSKRKTAAPAEVVDSRSDSDEFFNAFDAKKHKCAHKVNDCMYVSNSTNQMAAQDATVRLESCELATPLLARLH